MAALPMPSTIQPDAGLLRLADALTLAGAFHAALDGGILGVLERAQPMTAEALAARCHVDERAVALVLAALATGGVVLRDDGGEWRLSGSVEAWALMDLPAKAIGVLLDTGRPAWDAADPDASGPRYARAGDLIARFSSSAIDELSSTIARPGLSVLEVGAGAAPWSWALMRLDRTIQVTMLDLPPVAERLRRAFPDVRVVAGDVRTVELEGSFDVVILSGLCHLLSAGDNERVFMRCSEWCAPAGDVLVFDAVDTTEADLALYALSLATRTVHGRTWSLRQYRRWLTGAGFSSPWVTTTNRAEQTLLRATLIPQPPPPCRTETESP